METEERVGRWEVTNPRGTADEDQGGGGDEWLGKRGDAPGLATPGGWTSREAAVP